MNKSEQRFLDYCNARGYSVERIEECDLRTPDYRVVTPNSPVITEVKEIAPSEEDKNRFDTLKPGVVVDISRSIGDRVRSKLHEAYPQLRRFKDSPEPKVLVVYDALSNNPRFPFPSNDFLSSLDIESAMFGDPIVRFWPDGKPDDYPLPDWNYGGNRRLTHERGLYIAAVAALMESDDIYINFYHNPFTTRPLFPAYFADSRDRHFIKPSHPDIDGQGWAEYVGERN